MPASGAYGKSGQYFGACSIPRGAGMIAPSA